MKTVSLLLVVCAMFLVGCDCDETDPPLPDAGGCPEGPNDPTSDDPARNCADAGTVGDASTNVPVDPTP